MNKYKRVGMIIDNEYDYNSNISILKLLDSFDRINIKYTISNSIVFNDKLIDCLIISFLDYYRIYKENYWQFIISNLEKVVISGEDDIILTDIFSTPHLYTYTYYGDDIIFHESKMYKGINISKVQPNKFEFYFGNFIYDKDKITELYLDCERGLFSSNPMLEDYI